MNDIIINKVQSIQRCIARAREEYYKDPDSFAENYTLQDAAILNVLRACEQSIDLANHLVQVYQLGIPVASAQSFELLQAKGIIESALAEKLKHMVRFRNIVIHQYQRADIEIVQQIIVSGLDDLITFGDRVMALSMN